MGTERLLFIIEDLHNFASKIEQVEMRILELLQDNNETVSLLFQKIMERQ